MTARECVYLSDLFVDATVDPVLAGLRAAGIEPIVADPAIVLSPRRTAGPDSRAELANRIMSATPRVVIASGCGGLLVEGPVAVALEHSGAPLVLVSPWGLFGDRGRSALIGDPLDVFLARFGRSTPAEGEALAVFEAVSGVTRGAECLVRNYWPDLGCAPGRWAFASTSASVVVVGADDWTIGLTLDSDGGAGRPTVVPGGYLAGDVLVSGVTAAVRDRMEAWV